MKDYHYAILASSLVTYRKYVKMGTKIDLAEQITAAVETLVSGGVVAFPTDTVYGLGAVYNNCDAIRRIYSIKGRSRTKALPLIIADYHQLEEITSSISNCARLLMQAFWPGALTLVLPRSGNVADDITGGLNTVAVRMPNHPVPLALAGRVGCAICATSANISGRKSSASVDEVKNQLGSLVDYIIYCQAAGCGTPSTLVDATGEIPKILREGGIAFEQINRICKTV